jgi:hypothetical protein
MFVSILILLLKGGEVGISWEPSKKAMVFQKLGSTEKNSTFTLLFKGCAMAYIVSCKLLTMEALV